MTDYPGAIWIPNNNYFPDTGKKSFIILHGTAGGSSAQGIASFFRSTEGTDHPASTHYIIGQDGIIVQTVKEANGAYGNGLVNNPDWSGNPNYYTISIEHVKGNTDNSNDLTEPQKQASFKLIEDICNRNGIGKHDADDNTGITSHAAIDPINRARCPGLYPWQELWLYLKGGSKPMEPTANQKKAADDCWNSVLGNVRKGTGIYQVWLEASINGTFYGPPLTQEYSSINWSGQSIIVQEFARARCEWDGSPHWYGLNGKI